MILDEVLGMIRSNRFILGIHHIRGNWFLFKLLYIKWTIRIYSLIIGIISNDHWFRRQTE
jgi:hypothetical protein